MLFLALAALPTPATRVSQAVLAAVMVRIGFLFTAIALPGLFDAIIKRMIGRARPTVSLPHVDPLLFAPFIWRADYASLPSGHATTAFAVHGGLRQPVAARAHDGCCSTRWPSRSAASSCWAITLPT